MGGELLAFTLGLEEEIDDQGAPLGAVVAASRAAVRETTAEPVSTARNTPTPGTSTTLP